MARYVTMSIRSVLVVASLVIANSHALNNKTFCRQLYVTSVESPVTLLGIVQKVFRLMQV